MAETDYVVTIGLIIVGSAITGFITWLFKFRDRKDSVEKTASDKKTVELQTASLLEARTEKIAEKVNKDVFDRIGNLFATLRSEIALRNQAVNSEMRERDTKIDQNKKDAGYNSSHNKEALEDFIDNVFTDFKKDILDILKKQAREIQRMQSMTYAEEAHSFPSYMFDLDKKDDNYLKDPIGLYKIQSREDKEKQTRENEKRLKEEQDDKNTAIFEAEEDKKRLHKESGEASEVGEASEGDKKKLQKESEDVADATDKIDDDKPT